ncbi:FG-GAP-like repeat-containing protein [Pelagibaculum spongiae]|uniref:Dystroglycan-type cadherin-like domain-containing protein n=1 Tax=Pelagibaculum spongiae TaxID=2080658 RepID=A0A2V1GVL2_9GAMM|nr:FG-GAP-like repeat-containing protein [Pelagibaculum spongiae]PVZ68381.1 hypothetical protein DC094_13965 [Pelagibaculum spongiae]
MNKLFGKPSRFVLPGLILSLLPSFSSAQALPDIGPVLSPSSFSALSGQAFNFNIDISDTNGGAFTFQNWTYPAVTGVSVNSATGAISGLIATPGIYQLYIRAQDATSLSDTEYFTLKIYDAVNQDYQVLQSFSAKSGITDQATTYTLTAQNLNSHAAASTATVTATFSGSVSLTNTNDDCVISNILEGKEISCNLAIPATGEVQRQFSITPSANRRIAVVAEVFRSGLTDIDTANNRSERNFYAYSAEFNAASQARAYSENAAAIILEDLNKDTRPDLVLFPVEGYPSVMLNQGNGTFAAPVVQAGYLRTRAVAAADIDNDSLVDIFAITHRGAGQSLNGRIIHFEADANGQLQVRGNIDGIRFNSDKLDFGDVNNDGYTDLIIGSQAGDSNTIVYRNTNGSFSTANNINIHTGNIQTALVAIDDLSGDKSGYQDIMVGTFDEGSSQTPVNSAIYKNNKNSVFSSNINTNFLEQVKTFSSEVISEPKYLTIGDANGDGDKDLLLTSVVTRRTDLQRNNTSRLYINSDYSFSTSTSFISNDLNTTHIMDIESDNDNDIVVINKDGSTQVWTNQSNVFGLADYTLNLPEQSLVVSGFLNDDTFPDLVTVSKTGAGVRVFLNPLTGSSAISFSSTSENNGGVFGFGWLLLLFSISSAAVIFRKKFRE